MNNTYKLVNNPNGEFIGIIKNNELFIPIAEDNTDYQEYLQWTKASPMNVAEPADEVTE